jgi:hypothetical protein
MQMKAQQKNELFTDYDYKNAVFSGIDWLSQHYDPTTLESVEIKPIDRETLHRTCSIVHGSRWNPFSPHKPKDEILFYSAEGELLGQACIEKGGTVFSVGRHYSVTEQKVFEERLDQAISRVVETSGQAVVWAIATFSTKGPKPRLIISKLPKDWEKFIANDDKNAAEAAKSCVAKQLTT